MSNREVREAAKRYGVRLWELADALGIADTTLCRQMRREFPENKKVEALNAIKRIAEKAKGR